MRYFLYQIDLHSLLSQDHSPAVNLSFCHENRRSILQSKYLTHAILENQTNDWHVTCELWLVTCLLKLIPYFVKNFIAFLFYLILFTLRFYPLFTLKIIKFTSNINLFYTYIYLSKVVYKIHVTRYRYQILCCRWTLRR